MKPIDIGLPRKFSKFRQQQLDTIIDVASDDNRFTLLNGPTGSGKSLIYMGVAKLLEARTLVLVGTKTLQKQLMSDFQSAGMVDIRGHRNYPCSSNKKQPIWGQICNSPGKCDYVKAVTKAKRSQIVVSNFAYWMSLARYSKNPDQLGDFDLIIIDEAHTAPDWLASMCTIELDRQMVKIMTGDKLPTSSVIATCANWARGSMPAAEKTYKMYDNMKDSDPQVMSDVVNTGKQLRFLSIADKDDVTWVKERTSTGVKFLPVWAHPYAERYLFKKVPKIVMCSATLTRSTAKHLGVSDYTFIDMLSTFPSENSPFTHKKCVKVDQKITPDGIKKWIDTIDSIIDNHLDSKGIIHCRSYARAKLILEMSRHSGIMVTHKTSNSRRVIKDFKLSTAPRILVSPSVEEGADFPGAQCEFQIIAKVPFLYIKDPVTRLRMDSDKDYSNVVTSQSIIQMVGRGTRTPTDKCDNYIVDDHWSWFKRRGEWPQSFKKTWRRQ